MVLQDSCSAQKQAVHPYRLGYGYEMEAIAACTIGGVSVTGGRGKVSSAIIGVAVFEIIESCSAVPGSELQTHSASHLVSLSSLQFLWISESI